MSAPQIGWIGAGAMGRPMVLNLLRAGHRVRVYDLNPSAAAPLLAAGAETAASPRELAVGCEWVFSTIFDDAGLREIALGEEGLRSGARPGLAWLDMSTVSPAVSAEVAQGLAGCGIAYLRAPVSGTVALAESARLSTFVSGPRDAYERALPLLRLLTARQSHVGPADEARAVKLLINLLVFTSTAALGEALAFGARAGLDRGLMLDAINDSIVGSSHYRAKTEKLKARDYSPAGSLALVTKDLDLAFDVAHRTGVPMPLAAQVREQLAALQARGLSGLDVAALAEVPDLLTGEQGLGPCT